MRPALRVDQDGAGLQVAVHHPVLMRFGDGAADPLEDLQLLEDVRGGPLQILVEVDAQTHNVVPNSKAMLSGKSTCTHAYST